MQEVKDKIIPEWQATVDAKLTAFAGASHKDSQTADPGRATLRGLASSL